MIEVKEGSDEILEFEILDEFDTPIPINTLINIQIDITDECVRDTFKLNDVSTSEKPITIIDSENGQIAILLDRNFTNRFPGKKFDIIITVIFNQSANPIFPTGEKHNVVELEKMLKIERVRI